MDLPLNCFVPKITAKCCFQIWVRTQNPREKIILPKSHSDFLLLPWGPKDSKNQPTPNMDADFVMRSVGWGCGRLYTENLISLRPKSYHWIKSRISVDLLKERFGMLDYSISKDTCRQDSIGKKELIQLYINKFN
jgi:hypothetical protein